MSTIIGISGSLRKGSFNASLLRAAAELAPRGCTVDIDSIKDFPLYNADVEESDGIPKVVAEVKARISSAAGLLLVTPEYNNSIPGVFKNAIDWLSRPPEDIPKVFGNRPVGLIGATPGRFGTILSQTAWLSVLRFLGTRVWLGKQLYVSGAMKVFDESGSLVDEKMGKRIEAYMAGFAAFVTS